MGSCFLARVPTGPDPLHMAKAQEVRQSARDLGIVVGVLPPGPLNAITDVAGVLVGLYRSTQHRTAMHVYLDVGWMPSATDRVGSNSRIACVESPGPLSETGRFSLTSMTSPGESIGFFGRVETDHGSSRTRLIRIVYSASSVLLPAPWAFTCSNRRAGPRLVSTSRSRRDASWSSVKVSAE